MEGITRPHSNHAPTCGANTNKRIAPTMGASSLLHPRMMRRGRTAIKPFAAVGLLWFVSYTI
jgi:hypothetical protein